MIPVISILRRFSIRVRMAGAIAMVLALFGIVGIAGFGGGLILKRLNDSFLTQSLQHLGATAQISTALDAMRVAERDLALGYEENNRNFAQNRQTWASNHDRLGRHLQSLAAVLDEDNRTLVRELTSLISEYGTAAAAVFKNLEAQAYDTGGASLKAMRVAFEKSAQARGKLTELEQAQRSKAERIHAESTLLMERLAWAFGAIMMAVVALVVPLTLANSASITKPITYAQDVARSIANGDLSRHVQVDGRDEASHMLAALHDMQQSLTRMVTDLRESSSTIQQASLEVASGSGDLSHRTEQSAGSLQRTAASMVQLTQTVQQSAGSAETANRLAGSAAEIAERGGHVVSQVVAAMDDIHASSRRIADIIGTIDGIAFQTNILALNAAVEAARAGEQGRGFAVVAGEVRLLAQRSASAAREIKQLIDNSVARVEDGSRLVKDAGSTMADIVGSFQKVSEAIGEITTSTREQSQGIVQVNAAIHELDQMTQQNAALVEQSAAASANIGEQAARLAEMVQRFKAAH